MNSSAAPLNHPSGITGEASPVIPEGWYSLEARWRPRLDDHILVEKVPGRDLILFYPANNALEELKGCIAPVSNITGPGRGSGSRSAFRALREIVYDARS